MIYENGKRQARCRQESTQVKRERERDRFYNGKNAEGNGLLQGHVTALFSDSLQDLLLAEKIKK
jgi:hypothetical protein